MCVCFFFLFHLNFISYNLFSDKCLTKNILVHFCIFQKQGGNGGPIDLDKTTIMLEPEKTSGGGLMVPGKDRVVFRPPERKSLLGNLNSR